MDFFERQDIARKQTGRLVVLFVLAVIAIVCAMNFALFGILHLVGTGPTARQPGDVLFDSSRLPMWQRPEPYIGVTLVTLGIIACGSFYKMALLSRGGPAVAQMMGGRPIDPLRSPEEKTLQNVVEEMSIASGVPVPQIFVMDDEDNINAFAAGFTTADATIGVTRGCVARLSRDELQGVIAHEFSHVLNGDMRLNLRLIGILNGILVIALIGYGLLRSLQYVRIGGGIGGGGRRDRKNDGGQIMLLILAAGAALVVIGYVGLFFGRLIQAAVSRQREYLADASAVQFTRNPTGLAGALKKIAGVGSQLRTAHAIETAHLFFATGIKVGLTDLLATHPPIEQRIRALDPTFDGRIETPAPAPAPMPAPAPAPRESIAPEAAITSGFAANSVASSVGRANARTVQAAAEILSVIPDEIARAARDPFGARVVAIALLLSDDLAVRTRQLQSGQALIDYGTLNEAVRMMPAIAPLNRTTRVALLDLIQPAIRQMSGNQVRQFGAGVQRLIEADGRVTLFEFAMYRQLKRAMSPPPSIQFMSIQAVTNEIITVLSALAYHGKGPQSGAESFRAGLARLDINEQLLASNDYSLAALDPALDRLAAASPGVKRRLIDAAAYAISSDGVIQPDEAEILRALCAALDVPLPPLV